LRGPALHRGGGVSYWSIASLSKSAAGISDDEPDAFAKLRAASEDDAVAELLAVVLGVEGGPQPVRDRPSLSATVSFLRESVAPVFGIGDRESSVWCLNRGPSKLSPCTAWAVVGGLSSRLEPGSGRLRPPEARVGVPNDNGSGVGSGLCRT
jgi:hypothetical protein